MDTAKIKRVWDAMSKDEQDVVSLGIFPARFISEKLDNHECVELIRMSQVRTKVRY